jgi:hypothetical protein
MAAAIGGEAVASRFARVGLQRLERQIELLGVAPLVFPRNGQTRPAGNAPAGIFSRAISAWATTHPAPASVRRRRRQIAARNKHACSAADQRLFWSILPQTVA